MCVVSMVGDFYKDKWFPQSPETSPYIPNPWWLPNQCPNSNPDPDPNNIFQPPVSKEEFEALKKEVLEMKELLKRAKIYDEQNNEKDCELEEKMKFLRIVAKSVGVDLDEVLKKGDPK